MEQTATQTTTQTAESTDHSPIYELVTMRATADRSEILSDVLRRVCAIETVFSDYQRGCEDRCYVETPTNEMCERCQRCMRTVANSLLAPNARVWEVWKLAEEESEIVGIVRVSRIVSGEDAVGHYVFFDGSLSSKTAVLRDVIDWLFTDHEEANWSALRRLTVEIPDYAFALARHAHRKLGFNGEFTHEVGGVDLNVEGVKRDAVEWRGQRRDLLILGLLNTVSN